MHLLFLDESGRIEDRRLFALGGIAVRDTDWHELRDLWQGTLRDHGWPLDQEVKWHGVRNGSPPSELADAVYDALARAPITCFVALLDCRAGTETGDPDLAAFFATPEDTYATALTFLAERFEHLLEAKDDVGLIVVDGRHREDDARLRRFFADLAEDGTPYMGLGRIVEGLHLGPSHHSIGLQVADLVVGATAAAERGQGDGQRYLRLLEPRFAHHPVTGALEGVGLKRFPEAVPRPREHTRLF